MKDDLIKHKLLGILSMQFIISGINTSENIGLTYDEILEKLKITRLDLDRLTAELFVNKEIAFQNIQGPDGLFSNEIGVMAFSTKKYKKRHNDQIINISKNITQILVPILSLLIAILAIIWKIDANSENNKKVEVLEKRIIDLEKIIKTENKKKQ